MIEIYKIFIKSSTKKKIGENYNKYEWKILQIKNVEAYRKWLT